MNANLVGKLAIAVPTLKVRSFHTLIKTPLSVYTAIFVDTLYGSCSTSPWYIYIHRQNANCKLMLVHWESHLNTLEITIYVPIGWMGLCNSILCKLDKLVKLRYT